MRILVTGGAGYIGSVIVERLLAKGHTVVVYDNLSNGHRDAIAADAQFIEGDLSDYGSLLQTLREYSIEAVIHLAGSSLVGESMCDPQSYYANNVVNGMRLLDAMLEADVLKIIFSSSAAVYGAGEKIPITEDAALSPANPYGETKAAFERILRWYDEAFRLRYVSLRYFNVAGASDLYGEDHKTETHLIPNILKVAAGESESVLIYGEDYPTPDGTCVRDFVHVIDLADAHLLALNVLDRGSEVYNVGYGSGYSVAEVVEMARQVTGRWISTESAPRRAGDSPVLIAGADKIMGDLGWTPRHSELDRIIESAWRWKLAHPKGYAVR